MKNLLLVFIAFLIFLGLGYSDHFEKMTWNFAIGVSLLSLIVILFKKNEDSCIQVFN